MKAAAAGVAVLVLLTGCSSYNDKRGRGDAPVVGNRGDDSPAEVYNFPDKFGNLATKCVGHGYRAWMVTHGKTDVQPVLTPDASCGGGR